MSDERREHSRFSVNWRGRIAYQGELYDIAIRDVSKGGVGIDFPFLLTIGTKMSVEFHVKYQSKMMRLRAKTRVVFNTMLSNNSGARLGLQFTAMAKDEIHILSNVLHLLEDDSE
ncbi:MAG: PilZ domain-containing protein [Agarilytica sp.]